MVKHTVEAKLKADKEPLGKLELYADDEEPYGCVDVIGETVSAPGRVPQFCRVFLTAEEIEELVEWGQAALKVMRS